MKVALVIPPLPKGVLRESVCVSPPLNVPYQAAVLREAGHSVSVIDAPASSLDSKEVSEAVSALSPGFVGVTSLSQTYPSSLEVSQAIKEKLPDVPLATGGPHATFYDVETVKKPYIDIVVRAEGERTIVELADAIEKGRELADVLGITYRTGERITTNRDRPFIQDLDSLPFPAYDLLPLDSYGVLGSRRIFLLQSSRGCPYGCTFCVMFKMDGNRFRARSAKNVVDEIELLVKLGADSFSFCDETFTLDAKRVEAICDEIAARKLQIPWDCQTRADRLDPLTLQKMRRAGCELLCIGVESGSQRLLDKMQKHTTVQQNREAILKVKEAGVAVSTSLMIGYPGEDEETLNDTLRFVKTAKPDIAFLNVATPFPGTEFFDEMFPHGLVQDIDWQRFDVTTPVFDTPTMSMARLSAARRSFYDSWYSPGYVARNFMKRNFYNQTMAWFALTYIRWRLTHRAKKLIFRSFR